MKIKNWILELKSDGILTEGYKNDNLYFHLRTPCKIIISEGVIDTIEKNYDSVYEKGGLLIAFPRKEIDYTILQIDKIIFLNNISDDPQNSYLEDDEELDQYITEALRRKELPIMFHTHPTSSDNPIYEILQYLYQSDTSEQDQLVSDYPIHLDDIELLMPSSLVLRKNNQPCRTFIGFYNGLIAPIEFQIHKNEQIKNAIDTILNAVSEWSKEKTNIPSLIGGGVLFAFLIIRFNKFAIPLILLLIAMLPMFINDQQTRPKYFAQLTAGDVIIELP